MKNETKHTGSLLSPGLHVGLAWISPDGTESFCLQWLNEQGEAIADATIKGGTVEKITATDVFASQMLRGCIPRFLAFWAAPTALIYAERGENNEEKGIFLGMGEFRDARADGWSATPEINAIADHKNHVESFTN